MRQSIDYAPAMLFPIEGGGFANSQVLNPGGYPAGKPYGGTQCDPSNYNYPWEDTFCEDRPQDIQPNSSCPDQTGHHGLDVRGPTCRPDTVFKHWVIAPFDATVTYHNSPGHTANPRYIVEVRSTDDGTRVTYLHMTDVMLASGQRVRKGDRIGAVGNLGPDGKPYTTYHLHVELEQNGSGTYKLLSPYFTLEKAHERLCATECDSNPDVARVNRLGCVGRCSIGANCPNDEDLLIRNRYYRSGATPLAAGLPFDGGGTAQVHEWFGVYLQDFQVTTTCGAAKDTETFAIIANSKLKTAYVVRQGIWAAYKCLSDFAGPKLLGAPTSEELVMSFQETHETAKGLRQDFTGGYIWYGPGSTCPTSKPCLHVHVPGYTPSVNADCRSLVVVSNEPGPESCADTCTAGTKTCTGSDTRSFCGSGFGGNPCLTMSSDQLCVDDTECFGGDCVPPGAGGAGGGGGGAGGSGCIDECSVGAKYCADPSSPWYCGAGFDSDSCLEFGPGAKCGLGMTCTGGDCVPGDAGAGGSGGSGGAGGSGGCTTCTPGAKSCVDQLTSESCGFNGACNTWTEAPCPQAPSRSYCKSATGECTVCGPIGQACCPTGLPCDLPLICQAGACLPGDAGSGGNGGSGGTDAGNSCTDECVLGTSTCDTSGDARDCYAPSNDTPCYHWGIFKISCTGDQQCIAPLGCTHCGTFNDRCCPSGLPCKNGGDCLATNLCSACVVRCAGKECGPNGCGGSCGTCAAGSCVNGSCVPLDGGTDGPADASSEDSAPDVGCVPAGLEVCDGIDNDCDGATDDGLGSSTCGVGDCKVTQPNCVGGVPQVCVPKAGTTETCDGKDNDCDGATDDAVPPGGSCSTGLLGVCSPGTLTCFAGTYSHCEQVTQATSEACNGADDNCDGRTDEGNPGGGGACSTGKLGACAAGTVTCVTGELACVQNASASSELCGDGVDNDCDGPADCQDSDCQGATNCSAPDASADACVPSCAGKCAGESNGCSGTCTSPCSEAGSDGAPDGAGDAPVDVADAPTGFDVVVRCTPPSGWSVEYQYYAIVPATPGPWDNHYDDHTDFDPGTTFETRVTLQPGQRLEVAYNLRDNTNQTRWAFDFSTDPTGSGQFGVPQCATTATVNGAAVAPLKFVPNPTNPDGAPWCFYTNLSVATPTALAPAVQCN